MTSGSQFTPFDLHGETVKWVFIDSIPQMRKPGRGPGLVPRRQEWVGELGWTTVPPLHAAFSDGPGFGDGGRAPSLRWGALTTCPRPQGLLAAP